VPSLTVTHRVIEAVQALAREVAVVVEPGVVGDALAEPHHRVEDLRQLVPGLQVGRGVQPQGPLPDRPISLLQLGRDLLHTERLAAPVGGERRGQRLVPGAEPGQLGIQLGVLAQVQRADYASVASR
jgi:hypothetical protein